MDVFEKQNEIKIDILESLARSQRALAKIIESVADVAGRSETAAENILDHIETIGRYQRVLAEKMSGVRISKIEKGGNPARPWLNENIRR